MPQTLNLTIGGSTQIPMATTMPALDVTYTPANSITVTNAGTYSIDYNTIASVAAGAGLTLAVRRNGTNIPSATKTRTLAAGVESPFAGSIIINLTAGDVIDMAFSALVALGVTLGSGVNASLTVKKLD